MFEGRRAPVETLRRLMALDRANSQRNRAIKERHPDCKGRGTVHTIDEECDHCRKCGGNETDPDGLCEICLKCSLCCDDQPCPLEGEENRCRRSRTSPTPWADVFYR